MKNLRKFVGEYAYNTIKNIAVDDDAICRALITPQNARAVFANLTEFEIKSLCAEISNSGTIGQVKNATKEEITEAFMSVGYDTVIFDDEAAISECRKYYRHGEVICTYNNLQQRMRDYHMLVAVKADIDEIERSENPDREDQYGTSILNIQIARNGSHMSIKNRYNHAVLQPDSTLNNNLDVLYSGLQGMVLGYYGFASLSDKKSYYANIVNIGGVYLKYHTERDNIYYGAFVLDGVNGARFTDTSRYYVTEAIDRYRYLDTPLVLDFKNKKALDVSEEKEKRNGKATLLSGAMGIGILTSANKQEANALTLTLRDVKRELLQCRKKALQFIHEAFGYDFTKPYQVTGFLGKFTAKSIEKATGSDKGILLIYTRRDLKVCKMENGRFYVKDLKGNRNYGIDTFYQQQDFEIVRKSGGAAVYVIQQEEQYIGKPKPEARKVYYGYSDNGKHRYDKSGCNLTESRFNLSQRLGKYKAKKRASEVSQFDYTRDINEIDKSFVELKTSMITLLTNAKTLDDYDKLQNIISYELTLLVENIESVKNHSAKKSFLSVEYAQKNMSDIKARIEELKTKCL